MIKKIKRVEYVLPNANLTVQIDKSKTHENESVLTMNYKKESGHIKFKGTNYLTRIIEDEKEFDTIINKHIREFEREYAFYNGMIREHKYFHTFSELVENCKQDIFTWIKDRQISLDLGCQSSVQGMVDTLSEYAKFLEDVQHVSDKQRVARGIEGMYGWLNDSVDWKVYQDGNDLASY